MAGMVNTPVAATFPASLPERAPIKLDAISATYPVPPFTRPKMESTTSTQASITRVPVKTVSYTHLPGNRLLGAAGSPRQLPGLLLKPFHLSMDALLIFMGCLLYTSRCV